MPTFLLYILKLSCSLSIVWLFYRIFLHDLTFYNSNRWYLVGYALLSFFIPFINIGPIDREDPALQPLIVQYIPVIGEGKVIRALSAPRPAVWAAWSWPGAVLVVLGLGTGLLLLRFAVRCLSLRRMRRRAELIEDGQIRIYRVRDRISPFSFGNAIYINTSQHSEKEQEEIILHEYVHIRQRHTADILFAELLTIFNWFNPFAWLIRYSIRQNLEFIADRQVVENGFDKKDYQYHLLKVVGQAQYRLANNFNFSSLKKRIVMMNRSRSTRLHLLKFLFILPLLGVLLVAFRDVYTSDRLHTMAAPVVDVANLPPLQPAIQQTGSPRSTGRPRASASRSQTPARADTIPKRDSIRPPIVVNDSGFTKVSDGASQLPGSASVHLYNPNAKPPLFIIDGSPAPGNSLASLNPNDIASIQVLKAQAGMAVYGDKARDGVVLITTKKKTHSQVLFHAFVNGENITMQADSIITPEGTIRAVDPPAKP